MSRYTVQYGTLYEAQFEPLMGCLAAFPIYDEEHRSELVTKIYNRYRFREIGFETPMMFVHYLNATLSEIMPIYNELYKTAALDFNILDDVNYFEETQANSSSSNVSDASGSGSVSSSGGTTHAHSDTPQGSFNFSNISANEYLSDADINSSENRDESQNTSHATAAAQSAGTGARHVHGKTGGRSYGEMIKEYRDTIINIDKMILDELATCFMGVY